MTITRVQRSSAHEYTVYGQPYEGVTNVIGSVIRKPGLERWIGKLGNEESKRQSKEAAEHGTLVHALAALRATGTPSIPMTDESLTGRQIADFSAWWDAYVDRCYGVEIMVAHATYRYAGTLDLLVHMRGDPETTSTIVDIKTGKDLWPEMRLQTAAYRAAALTEVIPSLGLSVTHCRRALLHLPAQDRPRFVENDRHSSDFHAFLCCLYIYRDLKRGLQ